MLGLLRRDTVGVAQVCYRGSAPPPAEGFGWLRDSGIEIVTAPPPADALWGLSLRHRDWGEASLAGYRELPAPDDLVRFAANLSAAERSELPAARSGVILTVPARRGHVLADRKTLLRFGRALLGSDGVLLIDLTSQLPWPRAALDDELAHDADLDVEALYALHAVQPDETEPGAGPTPWLHTHGLAAVGAFDIDVVGAHQTFVQHGADLLRAIAFAALDGDVAADASSFVYAAPDRRARFVPVDRFMREADSRFTGLRDADGHDGHAGARSVLCETGGRRFLGFGGGDRPEPLRLARGPFPDPFVALFTGAASEVMAARARATIPVLRRLAAEFAEFGVTALVKLGYPTPNGGREHPWFEVHGFDGDTVDATLVNRPVALDLREGERAARPLELLSDWTLITPAGWVTPRSQHAARLLRQHADEIRTAMAAASLT